MSLYYKNYKNSFSAPTSTSSFTRSDYLRRFPEVFVFIRSCFTTFFPKQPRQEQPQRRYDFAVRVPDASTLPYIHLLGLWAAVMSSWMSSCSWSGPLRGLLRHVRHTRSRIRPWTSSSLFSCVRLACSASVLLSCAGGSLLQLFVNSRCSRVVLDVFMLVVRPTLWVPLRSGTRSRIRPWISSSLSSYSRVAGSAVVLYVLVVGYFSFVPVFRQPSWR